MFSVPFNFPMTKGSNNVTWETEGSVSIWGKKGMFSQAQLVNTTALAETPFSTRSQAIKL